MLVFTNIRKEMKSLVSWLLVFFMGMFWVFRVVVTLSAQFGGDFAGFIIINRTMEIALLFITLLCMVLIVKRIIWGGVIYFLGYGYYFGGYIINNAMPAISNGESMEMEVLQNVFIGVIALILGLIAIIDIAVQKTKKKHFSDNKTDWYFNNSEYDRKMDERADKNQYRTL